MQTKHISLIFLIILLHYCLIGCKSYLKTQEQNTPKIKNVTIQMIPIPIEDTYCALGILVMFLFLMTVVCFKHNKKKHDKSEANGLQMRRMVDDNANLYLELKGETRNAVSAWLFSFILVAIMVWRWGVDDNITRKLLCLSFFGLISIVCFFDWVVCLSNENSYYF